MTPTAPRFGYRDEPKPGVGQSVFALISADLLSIQRLCDAVVRWAEDDDERWDLFEQLRRELLAHIEAVADAVYRVLAAAFEPAVVALREEQRALCTALVHLERAPMSEHWTRQFAVLRSGLRAHVRTEADVLYGPARLELAIEDQVALGSAFEQARNHHLKRLGAHS